jgi:hypothetical protein
VVAMGRNRGLTIPACQSQFGIDTGLDAGLTTAITALCGIPGIPWVFDVRNRFPIFTWTTCAPTQYNMYTHVYGLLTVFF